MNQATCLLLVSHAGFQNGGVRRNIHDQLSTGKNKGVKKGALIKTVDDGMSPKHSEEKSAGRALENSEALKA